MKNVLYLSIDGLLDPLDKVKYFIFKQVSETNCSIFVCTIENKKNENKLEVFKKNENNSN